MKFPKLITYLKTLTVFVLLGAVLWSSASVSQIINSVSEKSIPHSVNLTNASHYYLEPYAPIQNKNAEPQAETEIRVEEEDNTEKDNGESAFGFLYEFNPTWVKISACSGRALFRIAGTNALYILHHSWKSYLI